MSKAEIIKKITKERTKAVNQYSNLQMRKEQLHLLIKQLENLSYSRPSNMVNMITSEINNELDYLQTTSKTIKNELSKAMKDKEEISKDLSYLQHKINQYDRRLSTKN